MRFKLNSQITYNDDNKLKMTFADFSKRYIEEYTIQKDKAVLQKLVSVLNKDMLLYLRGIVEKTLMEKDYI